MNNCGDNCIDCKRSTAPGSGLWVNRIPADNGIDDGYLCPDCQAIECARCACPTIDAEWSERLSDFICFECWCEMGVHADE